MTFSTEWEQQYKQNNQMSLWPWSDLISYVMRYTKCKTEKLRVLELGFGVGANIPFFNANNFDYYGVEGSQIALNHVLQRFPNLSNKLPCTDFTRAIPFNGLFDLIVDRASVTHNDELSITNTLILAHAKLIQGGKYIGIDWFSNMHGERGGGKIDKYTCTNFENGQFEGVGAVHFSDQEHLYDLFNNAGFNIDLLEHKLHKIMVPKNCPDFASWNLMASKKLEQ